MALHLPTDGLQTASWSGDSRLRRERLDLGAEFVEPSGATEPWLAEIWRELLRVDRIGARDDFFELGGNSFQAGELFLRIEQRTGMRLAYSTIIDHPTVAKLAALLGDNARASAGRCLVPLRTEGADPPLFFMHEVTGQLLAYRQLLLRLGVARKIYGLQYPGQDRDPFPRLSIPEMAAIYLDAVREKQPRGPYHLVGYSLGGPIAYEMAHQLRLQGSEVRLLVLIDPAMSSGKVRGLRRVARKLSHHLSMLSEADTVHWPKYLLRVLNKEFRRLPRPPGTAPSKGPQTLPQYLYAMHARYRPPAYEGPVKVLRCIRGLSYWNEKNMSWATENRNAIEIRDLPGDHTAIMGEPIVALVAAYLESWLAEADAAPRAVKATR